MPRKPQARRRRPAPQHDARQQRFIREYLKDGNATQAAIRAGYAASGAHVQGHRLLNNAKISAEIARYQKREQERFELSRERILLELTKMAYAEVAVKGSDKRQALVDLGKHLGLFKDKEEDDGTVTVVVKGGLPRKEPGKP